LIPTSCDELFLLIEKDKKVIMEYIHLDDERILSGGMKKVKGLMFQPIPHQP